MGHRRQQDGLREFLEYHEPALASDEVKNGLILNALARARADKAVDLSYWILGRPGECAVQMGRHSIVLGSLDESQCRNLAEMTAPTDYPGVIGSDKTAQWFVSRALELGATFLEPVPQQIWSLSGPPRYPGSAGHARTVTADNAALFSEWMVSFYWEAVAHDPVPSGEELQRLASSGTFLFWIANEQPVSMAGIVRCLRNSAAITGVYTPPALRGRGYAGSATAEAVERIYAEGRKTACLYTDLRNPASNRCYRKIGFAPVCGSLHFYRQM